jgi:hypothetical protein
MAFWWLVGGFVAYLIGAASAGFQDIGAVMTLCFGGAMAIAIYQLRSWTKNPNNAVQGRVFATLWIAVLGLFTLAGIVGVALNPSGNRSTGSASVAGASATTAAGAPAAPDSYPVDAKTALLRNVKLDFRWSKGGFDDIMIADFTINNPTAYSFKDFEIECVHSAPSGTRIDSNTRTIYQIVKAHSKKRVREQNMGFINTQAARSSCEIKDLVPID